MSIYSLVIRDTCTKTTIRYHYITSRLAKMKKAKSAMWVMTTIFDSILSTKGEHVQTPRPNNPTPRYKHKRNGYDYQKI